MPLLNIRKSNVFTVLAYSLCAPLLVQAQAAKPRVDAFMTVREQVACRGDSSIGISLTLTLEFINMSGSPLIMPRNSVRLFGHQIFHTEKASYAGRPDESFARDEDLGVTANFVKQAKSPDESFLILSPQQTFDRIVKYNLTFDYGEYQHYADTDHFIRFGATTFDTKAILYAGDKFTIKNMSEERVRNRWKRYGYLWLEGVSSQPVRIHFPAVTSLGKCN